MDTLTRIFRGLALILLIGLQTASPAQHARRDSLMKELAGHPQPDIERVAVLVYLSEACYLSAPADGIQYADEALRISKAIGNNKFEGNANRLKGLCFYMQSRYDQARPYFHLAYRVDSLRSDEPGMAASLTNLALIDLAQRCSGPVRL